MTPQKPLMCPNCNGMGPFLVLHAVDKVDRMHVADRTFSMAPLQVFYMCVSEGEGCNCGMVSSLEELTS